jgi:hypothetical protein
MAGLFRISTRTLHDEGLLFGIPRRLYRDRLAGSRSGNQGQIGKRRHPPPHTAWRGIDTE